MIAVAAGFVGGILRCNSYIITLAMNIRSQLLNAHSRTNADLIQAHVEQNPDSLAELMACLLSDEAQISQRSAMVVGNYGRSHPEDLTPWWEDLVGAIESPLNAAIPRAVIRYFSELDLPLPDSLESRLIERCVKAVTDPQEKTATSAFAMTFVAQRAAVYPESARRLNAALIRLIPSGSPGFQNRGRKTLALLQEVL